MSVETPQDTGRPPKKKSGKRSETPSVTFDAGYAVGWAMAVPHCFHSALDIELTPRVKKASSPGKEKREVMVWTEGKPALYDFSPGDIIYNNRAAYEQEWGKALKNVSVALQVVQAKPDRSDGRGGKISGSILVLEFRRKTDKSGLEQVREHLVTPDEFVSALKSGTLPDGTRL